MPQKAWVKVCGRGSLVPGKPRLVQPRGVPVLLVNFSGGAELAAFSNLCPHMSCPLHRGQLDGFVLTCPCHDWRFDLRSGAMLEAPEIRLAAYPARINGEDIDVQI